MIHSYGSQNQWMERLDEGITDCLRDHGVKADIKNLYLPDEVGIIEEEAERIRTALAEYTEAAPDLIFVCDDEALYSLLYADHPYAREVPVLFCGVDHVPYEQLTDYPNITGFTTKPDYEKCYQLARRLFGKIENVVVIAEDSWLGKQALTEAKEQFYAMPNLTQVYESYWSYNECDTIQSERAVVNPLHLRVERVDMLPGEVIRNMLSYRRYSFNILTQWAPFYSTLTHMGTAPFLMVNNEGFGDGRIGGYMTPPYEQTYEAMETGVELMRGAAPGNYPITASAQVPVFDWEQLQYWNIPPERLPENSILLNMPFREKYFREIIISGVILFLLIALFVINMVRLYRQESGHRNRVRRKLQKEQKELEITLDSLSEGVVSIDREGRIFSINQAALKRLGLEEEGNTYIGWPVFALFDIQKKDDAFYLRDLLQKLSQTNDSHKLHETAYMVTKTKKAFSIAGSISSLSHKEASHGTVITFHDTTSEYHKKEYLALSMISGDIFAWRYEQKSRSIHYDASFFQALGIKPNDTFTMNEKEMIRVIHPDDLSHWRKTMKGLISGEQEKAAVQLRIKEGNGEYHWWEYRVSALSKTLKDSQYTLVGICFSIRKFKETEQELIRLRDEAEKSDYLKGLFLANMSHEIRTPLNAILGFSSLIIGDQDLGQEERDEFMHIINANCQMLLKLINEILDISRIESGIVFRKEPCDLVKIAQETIERNKTNKPEGVEIRMNMPAEQIILKSDYYRLTQMLDNLLDNAFKFTARGYVELGCRIDNRHEVMVYVKDTGIGIAEEELEKIYERFYKTNEFKQGGGLGLPIVKEIIKRMRGRIHVESQPGEGTTFYVSLPLEAEETLSN
ncbi:PAS domain-containing protein [Parabacteroides sp. OttesenSCG-928-O15]|nr:PAS domain-containing protein [Parabacteroides sp. OttesenSCG-928-O15]